jgi:hypothetical protein
MLRFIYCYVAFHYAESHILFIAKLSFKMLNVILLSVVMLSAVTMGVVALYEKACQAKKTSGLFVIRSKNI